MRVSQRSLVTVFCVAALLAPLGAAQSRDGFHQAEGVAILAGDVTLPQAKRRARDHARALVIGRALGHQVDSNTVVRDASLALDFIHASTVGITYDETWGDFAIQKEGERTVRVAVDLRARVRPLGDSARAPAVRGRLNRAVIVAGEALSVTVESPVRAYFGLYALQSDLKVSRVYPHDTGPQYLVVEPGHALILPRPEDPGTLTSAPLPGNREDGEALVLVASARPLNFRRLAPAIGEAADETVGTAGSQTDFYQALSQEDLRLVSLRFLPFVVRRAAP